MTFDEACYVLDLARARRLLAEADALLAEKGVTNPVVHHAAQEALRHLERALRSLEGAPEPEGMKPERERLAEQTKLFLAAVAKVQESP
jgi:hypothetical protein